MSTATIALHTRPRPPLGPALDRRRVPFGGLVLSTLLHAAVLGAIALTAVSWYQPPSKTYIVNLVPAVAAVGRPQGRPTAPPVLPPRPSEVTTPAPVKTKPTELPQREARASTPPPQIPPRPAARESVTLPDRAVPSRTALRESTTLPDRGLPARAGARESMTLPDRALPPSRSAAVPRPADKELPAAAAAALPRGPSDAAPKREAAAPPPPAPLGQAAGSIRGVGAVTLTVSDFPYALYIQTITRKIQEQWEGRAIDGRQPEVLFEIGRDGQLREVRIGKSSGNPAYDRVALRAVGDANPFPPLPTEWPKSSLVVGLQFGYDPRGR